MTCTITSSSSCSRSGSASNGSRPSPTAPTPRQTLHERVADINRTIRQIRTSIFELRGPLGGGPDGIRSRILGIADDVRRALGFAPSVTFSGPVETALDDALGEDVAACVREALTNVAKHARATGATVDIVVGSSQVTVNVTDSGVGVNTPVRASGIANLAARAERRGGSFELSAGTAGGTRLIWKAPIA